MSYFKTVAYTTCLWFIMLVVVAFVFTVFKNTTGTSDPIATNLLHRIVLLSSLLLLLLFLKYGDYPLFHHFIANSFEETRFFRPLAITFAIMFILNLFAWQFGVATLQSWGRELFSPQEIFSQIVTVWLLSHLISAIAEEIFYRGIILNHFQSVFNYQLLSITFTALLFSAGHFHYRTLISFVIAFIAGVVLGFYYLKFRSITGAVGIHFGYNLFNNLITSDSSDGTLLPYLLNLDFSITGISTISWLEIVNIAAWITLFIFIFLGNTGNRNSEHIYHPAFDTSQHRPNQ